MERTLGECRILVTPTTYGKSDPRLRRELEAAVGEVIYNPAGRPLSSNELRKMLPGCDGYIAGLDRIDASALEAADRLRVLARYGAGVDNVDLAAARRKGVVVTNTPNVNSSSVAELTVGLILCLARKIPEFSKSVKTGEWNRSMGMALEGKRVGLMGFGNIGKEVARRLSGWSVRLIAYDLLPDRAAAAKFGVELVSQPQLLAESDLLSLHLPLLGSTRRIVNAEFLAMMKKGAFLINTSRGDLIDEAALHWALESGQLQGAALDTFVQEPPSAENPLLKMPSLIATPHCGGHTDLAMDAMGWGALEDCLAVLRGEAPLHPVTAKQAGIA
jgi:D-3-phosphoglycerate dehydrogenase / 2-oxoglutarate reductase